MSAACRSWCLPSTAALLPSNQLAPVLRGGGLLTRIVSANKAPATHAAQHAAGGADPITPKSIGAAPGGYGLGETPKYIANANDAVKNGRYAIDKNTLNLPGPIMDMWEYTYLKVDVGNRPDAYIKQTITSPYQGWHQCEVTRCFYDPRGGWQPWEWVNPPLLLGVEYRTTERYVGSPVYVKLVDFGALPNNNQKDVSVLDAGTMKCGIDLKMITSNNQAFKQYNGITVQVLQNGVITVATNYNLSTIKAFFLIKYTKSTD